MFNFIHGLSLGIKSQKSDIGVVDVDFSYQM